MDTGAEEEAGDHCSKSWELSWDCGYFGISQAVHNVQYKMANSPL